MMHEVMNEPMQRLRDAAQDLIQHGVVLHDELREILEGGFTVVDGCVYFTRELAANKHLSPEEMGAGLLLAVWKTIIAESRAAHHLLRERECVFRQFRVEVGRLSGRDGVVPGVGEKGHSSAAR